MAGDLDGRGLIVVLLLHSARFFPTIGLGRADHFIERKCVLLSIL